MLARAILPLSIGIIAVASCEASCACDGRNSEVNDTTFYERLVVTTEAMGARCVVAEDLDGDGLVDLVSASSTDNAVAWYKQESPGLFGGKREITFMSNGARIVATGDMDGDGIVDVVSASYYDDTIAFYKNDGSGSFPTAVRVTTTADDAQGVCVVDIDGDGDNDIASASSGDNTIAWYENLGGGNFCEIKNVVDHHAVGARTVVAGDFNHDGHVDLASASKDDNTIAWYPNGGAGNFTSKIVVNGAAMGAYSLTAADVDGDGWLDLVTASNADDTVAFYRNIDGFGTFEKIVIFDNADFVLSVIAGDLDHDGDIDVASASYFDGAVRWYENLDGNGSSWSTHTLYEVPSSQGHYVFIADMDGDGDNDLLAAMKSANEVTVYFASTECDNATAATEGRCSVPNCAEGTYATSDGACATCPNIDAADCSDTALANFYPEVSWKMPAGCSQVSTACSDFDGSVVECVCEANEYLDLETTTCTSCPDGQSKAVVERLPEDWAPNLAGADAAPLWIGFDQDQCEVDVYDDDLNASYVCGAGMFFSRDDGVCSLCTAGRYAEGIGMRFSCKESPVGTFSLQGAASPQVCASGQIATLPGSAFCESCPAGTFLADEGLYPFFHDEASDCSECAAGTFAKQEGSPSCLDCEWPADSTAGQAQCSLCVAKYVWNDKTSQCDECPEHATCLGGKISPIPEDGYWVLYEHESSEHGAMVFPCHRNTCQGAADKDETCWGPTRNSSKCDGDSLQCAPGAEGVLCASCRDDFTYHSTSGECVRCSDTRYVQLLIAVLVSLTVLYVAFLASSSNPLQRADSYALSIPPVRAIFEKIQPFLKIDVGKLKLVWVTCTIIGTAQDSFEIIFPNPVSMLISVYALLEFDLWGGVGVECFVKGMNYMARAYWTSIIPIIVVVLIWVIFGLRVAFVSKQMAERLADLHSQHMQASLAISYLFLPFVCSVQFRSLRCSELEGLDIRYLRADSSVDCDSDEYQTFTGRMILLLAVYLCIPLCYFVLLYQVKDRLYQPDATEAERASALLLESTDPDLVPLAFLFRGYKRRYWYWECIESYRRIFFMGVLNIVDTPARRAFAGFCLAAISAWGYREINPYEFDTTNGMNVLVQYQIGIFFLYGYLLIQGTDSGAFEGLDELVIAWAVFIFNLVVWLVAGAIACRYVNQLLAARRELRDAMSDQLARAKAESGASSLPKVLADFKPFGEVEDVATVLDDLNAKAELAAKFVKMDVLRSVAKQRRRSKRTKEAILQKSVEMSFNVGDIYSPSRNSVDKLEGTVTSDEGTIFSRRSPSTVRHSMDTLEGTVGSNDKEGLGRVRRGSSMVRSNVKIPNDVDKLESALAAAVPVLKAKVQEYVHQKLIIPTCDAVQAAAGTGFETVYLAVWNLVLLTENNEMQMYTQTVKALKGAAEGSVAVGGALQVASDLTELYVHAASIKDEFDALITSLATALDAEVKLPPGLKRMSRAIEKCLFDGEKTESCNKICDVVRAMFKTQSMAEVTRVAAAILESERVVIVRVKDRFLGTPSLGGWRDLMINFYLASDPNRHICEAQIVSQKMLVAREGLDGHAGYGRSRNALETLERLGAVDPTNRWRRAKYELDVEGAEVDELLHIGYSSMDLLKAGVEETQLRGKEGVVDGELTANVKRLKAQRDKADAHAKQRKVKRTRMGRSEKVKPESPAKVLPDLKQDPHYATNTLVTNTKPLTSPTRKTAKDEKPKVSSPISAVRRLVKRTSSGVDASDHENNEPPPRRRSQSADFRLLWSAKK